MKLVIEIGLGNEAMQRGSDVREAIREAFAEYVYRDLQRGWSGVLKDANGNTVGRWEVK